LISTAVTSICEVAGASASISVIVRMGSTMRK
jgi:hypothetical protein